MGNGVSSDQGNLPTHDKRDVRQSADKEQYDWSELAEAPETNSLSVGRNSYSGAQRGAEFFERQHLSKAEIVGNERR